MINVTVIPVLKDNYAYLLQAENGETAVIDPGDAVPVLAELEKRGLDLTCILNTHHHGDHTAGNRELAARTGAALAGPKAEKDKINGINILLDENSTFAFGGEAVRIVETPGHTLGHICFYFPESGIVFTGDTLFLMGCGRLFEGTAGQMWESLQKIAALPDDTDIYCGHEYTLGGARFCLSIEPDNEDLKTRAAEVSRRREKGEPTVPASLALEKKTNVFLRAGSAERFTEIRKLRDTF